MVTPSEMKLLYFPPQPPKASPSHFPQELYSSGIGMPILLWLKGSLAPQWQATLFLLLGRIKDISLSSLARKKAGSSLQGGLMDPSKTL